MIKAMLESQERAYKTALEMVAKQMNEHINKLEGKLQEVTTSLEFTQREVDELKAKEKDHDKEKKEYITTINKLTEEIQSSNNKIKDLEQKANLQEDYSRRKNVRISGMEERSGNETWEQTAAAVVTLFEDKMQLPGLVLERAHRVGPRRDDRPRPIVARFSRYCDREAVMRSARKLKGTKIFVNEDLCAASQAIKSAQFPLLKQARSQGKIAFFRHTKLIIKERTNEDSTERLDSSERDGGAVGGVRVSGQGESAADGVVTGTQVAGAWSGAKDDAFPSLPDGSRSRSSSVSDASPKLKTVPKKGLRSSVKK